MSKHQLFADKSDLYAAARPRYPRVLFEYLKEICQSTESAWDCACGNGQVAINLVEIFAHVKASDVSQEQISEAFKHDQIDYLVSQAESTPFANNAFDCVCVAQALHWFEHELFWQELDRVLKPGGVFAYWGYNFPIISQEIDALLDQYLYPVIDPYWAKENKLIWNNYADINVPYPQLPSPDFKMSVDLTRNQFVDFVHSWSAVRRGIEREGDTFFAEFQQQLSSLWAPSESRSIELRFCFFAYRK